MPQSVHSSGDYPQNKANHCTVTIQLATGAADSTNWMASRWPRVVTRVRLSRRLTVSGRAAAPRRSSCGPAPADLARAGAATRPARAVARGC